MKTPDRGEVLKLVRPLLERIKSKHLTFDFAFRYHNQIIELLEIRKETRSEHCFAMALYEARRGRWEAYWRRGVDEHQAYEPVYAPTLAAFFRLIEAEHRRFLD